MDPEQGNSQTTQGIWVSVASNHRTIIIDCEGTDSKERGENRLQFENCSSLFCLALSDVLLMNMWTQDVGRYTASNYNVLKMVFEMNLKLFQQHCAKKIVVVLRDYNEKLCKKEKFEKQILNDISALWNDIKKPENLKNSTPNEFFFFEFITLPHKIFEEAKFDDEIAVLRQRFDPSNKEYLFDHSDGGKGVPIESYNNYCASVWDTIIKEKDLNIPSQKQMLAIYRCNEIKDSAYQNIKSRINELNRLSTLSRISNYCLEVRNIVETCMNDYDTKACFYLEKIFVDVQIALKQVLVHETYISFTNQINRILPVCLKFFSKSLNEELTKGSNFFQTVTKVKSEHMERLKINIMEIKVYPEWEISTSEFEEQFDMTIESAKTTMIEKQNKEIIESLIIQFDEFLNDKLEGKLSSGFWFDINTEYCQSMLNKTNALRNSLTDFYQLDDLTIKRLLEGIEQETYRSSVKSLEKKTRELSSITVEYFKRAFLYDDNKYPRKWHRLTEEEIDSLYSKCQKETNTLFDIFSCQKLISNPISTSKLLK